MVDDELAKELYSRITLNRELRTAEVTSEWNLTPNDPLLLRDVIVADGTIIRPSNADVTFDRSASPGGEYTITTAGTNNHDSVSFESVPLGVYKSGSLFVTGGYVQKDSAPEGKLEAGFGRDPGIAPDGRNGAFLRYKSDGSYEFVIANNGVETVIPQSKWGNNYNDGIDDESGDKSGIVRGFDQLDGTGPSGIDLDMSKGFIVNIVGGFYGGAPIGLRIGTTSADGRYKMHNACFYEPEGQLNVAQPNQPVFIRLDNEGSTTEDSVKAAGRQYSTIGTAQDNTREIPHLNTGKTIGTTYEPLFGFRRKSGQPGIEVGPEGIQLYTDQRIHLYAEVWPDVDSANTTWNEPSEVNNSQNSATEVSDDITLNSQGTGPSFGDILAGSGKNDNTLSDREGFNFPQPRDKPIVVLARSLTGSAATVDYAIRFQESY